MHYMSQSMRENESGGRKNGYLLSIRSTVSAFFPLLLPVLWPCAGRTSKHCSDTSWILQSSALWIGWETTECVSSLSYSWFFCCWHVLQTQAMSPSRRTINIKFCIVSNLSHSSEDQFSSFQNKAELNEYNHRPYTTTFTLLSQVFQIANTCLITCWTWLDCSMVSSSNPIFINYQQYKKRSMQRGKNTKN